MEMKQQKVVYESLTDGPIKCKILNYAREARSTYLQTRYVELEVLQTVCNVYKKGDKFWASWTYVWLKGKWLPNSCKTLYEGKPAWDPDKTLEPACHGLAIPGAN